MEAPEGRGRITPLPPPVPDGTPPAPRGTPQPRLMAMATLGSLVLFALWLAGSGEVGPPAGAADGDGFGVTLAPLSAADTSTTVARPLPPVTQPPRLAEMVPWLRGTIILLGHTGDREELFVWTNGSRSPEKFELSAANIVDVSLEPATLNYVAYQTAGTVQALYVGDWLAQEPIFVGSQGFAWDPSGTAMVAWVGTDQVTGETALYRKNLADPTIRIADVPRDSWLAAWTEQGLVFAEHRGPRPTLTVLRNLDGLTIATAMAEPLRASPNGVIVALGTSDALAAAEPVTELDDEFILIPPPELVVLDSPANGDLLAGFTLREVPSRESLADGESLFSPDGQWSLSTDGDWAGRLVNRDTRATLVVQSLRSLSVRVVPLRGPGERTSVGFTTDRDQFFVFDPERSVMIVINWLTGAQFEFPIGGDIRPGGAYIRSAP